MDYKKYLINIANKSKDAARVLSYTETSVKDKALLAIAESLIKHKEEIKAANALDIEAGKQKGQTEALLDRLLLTDERIIDMAEGAKQIAMLTDPIGESQDTFTRPNGLKISKVRVPLGVIGIIYEARPNVTVDAAALCIKSGNATILRGGSEAINSNKAIAKIIIDATIEAGLPEGTVSLIDVTSREVANEMMRLNNYIDVLIPRGGAGLINSVVKNSTVPVIQTGVGNCHVYVDDSADLEMAKNIIINGKTQRPAVCNAIENVLIHKDIADEFIPKLYEELKNYKVVVRGCVNTCKVIDCNLACDEDFDTEFLDLILAVKIVDSIDDAIEHIFTHGSKHSECIVTSNYFHSQQFLSQVDAAAVYVNASTRFTDGSEFGFGAEIGISTQKLHARGPMGLRELTSSKYIIMGNGQIR